MIENRKSSIIKVLLQFDVLGNKDEFVRCMKPFAGMEDSVNWWALLCRLAALDSDDHVQDCWEGLRVCLERKDLWMDCGGIGYEMIIITGNFRVIGLLN